MFSGLKNKKEIKIVSADGPLQADTPITDETAAVVDASSSSDVVVKSELGSAGILGVAGVVKPEFSASDDARLLKATDADGVLVDQLSKPLTEVEKARRARLVNRIRDNLSRAQIN